MYIYLYVYIAGVFQTGGFLEMLSLPRWGCQESWHPVGMEKAARRVTQFRIGSRDGAM